MREHGSTILKELHDGLISRDDAKRRLVAAGSPEADAEDIIAFALGESQGDVIEEDD